MKLEESTIAETLAQAVREAIQVMPGSPERQALKDALTKYDLEKQGRERFRLQEGMGQVERAQQDLLRIMMENADAAAHRSLMQRMDKAIQYITQRANKICSCRAGIPSGADPTCALHGLD